MKRIPLENRAIALPLLGLLVAWAFFMVSQYVSLFTPQPAYDTMGQLIEARDYIDFSPYLSLLGIASGSIAALFGLNMAVEARHQNGEEDPLSRAAHRFTTLTVIIGLVAGAIFAIGNFMGAFNNFGNREGVTSRLIDVYIPIILATALVIFVLLKAFVLRKDQLETNEQGRAKLSDAQKALALGYVLPIFTTAIAIIFGLVVYDVTRTTLQVWVWVIIQLIIAFGIIAGTRFASRARAAKPAAPKPRTALAAGAANLNFVLSIIFGAVVSIMGFTFGFSAIENLRTWRVNSQIIEPITLQWYMEDFFPAKVLIVLAVIGIYLTITERNRKRITK